jgi:SAM-dependent methyltransferase
MSEVDPVPNVWQANLGKEVHFWDRWLTEAQFRDERDQRLRAHRPLQGHFVKYLNPSKQHYRILDVGSGPVSPIGDVLEGKLIELICTDPLASEYAALLDHHRIFGTNRPIGVAGEKLDSVLAENSFDIVSCNNALDHTENPLEVIKQMLRVCAAGGWVCISSIYNVGVLEHYYGLHQWNLDIKDERFILWRPDSITDVFDVCKIAHWTLSEHRDWDPPQFEVWIRKPPGDRGG